MQMQKVALLYSLPARCLRCPHSRRLCCAGANQPTPSAPATSLADLPLQLPLHTLSGSARPATSSRTRCLGFRLPHAEHPFLPPLSVPVFVQSLSW